MAGMRGSSSSDSFSLHRNRRVEPRMNSLGCCRSWEVEMIPNEKYFIGPHIIANLNSV